MKKYLVTLFACFTAFTLSACTNTTPLSSENQAVHDDANAKGLKSTHLQITNENLYGFWLKKVSDDKDKNTSLERSITFAKDHTGA